MKPPVTISPLRNKRPFEDALKLEPRKSSREKRKGGSGDGLNRSLSDPFATEKPSSSFRTDKTKTSFGPSSTPSTSAVTSPNTSFSSLYSGDSRRTSFDPPTDADTTIRRLASDGFLDSHPKISSLQNVVREEGSFFETIPKTFVDSKGEKSESAILENLRLYSPFGMEIPQHYAHLPFHQLYEVLRVSLASNVEFDAFASVLRPGCADYDQLWSSLRTIVRGRGAVMPGRSDLSAWERAGNHSQDISYGGKLEFSGQKNVALLRLTLSPLKQEPSNRLTRKFGSDRFLDIRFPRVDNKNLPQKMKCSPEAVHRAIIDWLVYTQHCLLGRKWQAYYGREDRSQKKPRSMGKVKDRAYRINLFAEDGWGFGDRPQIGEPDPRNPCRPPMSAIDLLQWFMSAECNSTQSALKMFARLQLAVSKTMPTVTFRPHQVFRVNDAHADDPKSCKIDCELSKVKKNALTSVIPSDSPVMNDGCARISRSAARAIADHLGLQPMPCAFQGRIGGAKGMWLIDTSGEILPSPAGDFWIEISDSQLKFESHRSDLLFPDSGRITFEVNDYPKRLSPSSLNFQLMSILEHGGVPAQVFMDILEEHLTTEAANLAAASDSALTLRRWNQRNNGLDERSRWADMRMQGGLPGSIPEKINWFVDHGFEPKTCQFLKDLLYQAFKTYCQGLEAKLDVGIGQSTFPFMLADPLAILEENEVHICFSNSFSDPKSDYYPTNLDKMDILVARLPAHLPSDIQRVRAVFKPELQAYQDVIIFPVKGSMSLAAKLSGGDYDGDRAWVCWDQKIVEPFRNVNPLSSPLPETFGIVKDAAKVSDFMEHNQWNKAFIRHGCDFNLRFSMLGTCSLYHEAFCYNGQAIDSPQSIEIAYLLGLLVDGPKRGYIYDEAKWTAYLRSKGLPNSFGKPAYKNIRYGKPTKHLIDRLVFEVAKGVSTKVLTHFAQQFADVGPRDDDLSKLWKNEMESAKSHPELRAVLSSVEAELDKIFTYWKFNCRPRKDEEPFGNRPIQTSSGPSFAEVVQHCRSEFVNIAPSVGSDVCIRSDRIQEWQTKHAQGQSSYWDLLKASIAFHKYYQSNFVWYMAGFELGEIKATAKGRGSYRIVCNEVYKALKVDGKFVDWIMRREDSEAMIIALEDCDDEYGSWDWDDGFA